jgi:hypothetical protein
MRVPFPIPSKFSTRENKRFMIASGILTLESVLNVSSQFFLHKTLSFLHILATDS